MKKLSLLICFFLGANLVNAHSLDKIYYTFDQDEKGGFLKVHFTPKAAIDLIIMLKPELENQSIIKLDNYFLDYNTYFNKTIKVKVNNELLELEIEKGDLIEHDATLVFRFKKDLAIQGNIEIKVTSFNNIYRRIKNYINIITPKEEHQCILTKSNSTCVLNVTKHVQKTESSMLYYLLGGILSFLTLFGIYKLVILKK